MKIIDRNKVERKGAKLFGEASTMGLTPGEWPEFIALDDEKSPFSCREAHLFHLDKVDLDDTHHYFAPRMNGGTELVILND